MNKKYTAIELIDFDTHLNGTMSIWADEITDGYHTMSELYEHKNRLFLALVKVYDNYITPLNCKVNCWKSKKHNDKTMYTDHFILGMTVTQPRTTFAPDEPDVTYEISYHLPMKYFHLAKVKELDKAPPFDGYTSGDVLERLLRL